MGSENKRVAKSGRVYYTRNKAYIPLDKKKDIQPFMHSTTDPHYLRYFERKTQIRSEYPYWHKMSPEQWRGYYERVYTLMQTDEDYQHWIKVVNATERQKIDWDTLDRKIQRSKDYPNGFTHDM
jgi:hypothetical protein